MRLRTLARTGLAAVLVTACSSTIEGPAGPADAPVVAEETVSSNLTGPELEEAAIDALSWADAVHLTDTTTDGEPGEFDLRLHGGDVSGSFSLQGHTLQVVLVDGAFYMQAPQELWASRGFPPVTAESLAGSMVLVPDGAEEFAGLTLAAFVEALRASDVTYDDEVTATELDGEPVWELTDSEGGAMLVAAVGQPYPLQITSTGAAAGVMRLSEIGTVAPIEPPAAFLDLADLGG
ncbi:hypothetical protein [Blastococcus sp. TF02A-26]|uniref:hypothetical protein n=1 Tax=Blastococcus sp. TF02A-26 TaxID=2250577 RepID=UPI000DE8588C|nr:hypothetical protein [Blastococcus sp. TF02A-26]RBY79954.1 hypothetical protein DQ240_21930 [Blastococcus sp. TF02A-26]